ncbi:MAG: TrmH family RNA methyltransferase [Thiobacillaceae bacterium]
MQLIASRQNPRYRALRDLAEDKRARRQRGETLLDGEHLLQIARTAGAAVLTLIATPEVQATGRLDAWRAIWPQAETILLAKPLLRALAPTQTPTGIMAVVAIPRPTGRTPRCAVLLEDIQDPGNLGAILRTAAAAGVDAVYLSQGCCEAWSPKALRGGQGAQLIIDVYEGVDLAAWVRAWPGPCHAAVLGAQRPLYALDLRGNCAFVFGNEGAGLSAQLRTVCAPFSIPMPGRTESLNVAAAAAVCLFERVRQLQGQGAAD